MDAAHELRDTATLSTPASEAAPASARTGPELNKASKPFTVEDRAKSWRLLITTIGLLLGSLTAVAVLPWWYAQLPASLLAGLTAIRLFIFFHDYLHGAIFRDAPIADRVFSVIGFYMLSVRSVWRETHNYHHKNNAKMIGSAIGSFPVLTLGMYKGVDEKQRRTYRVVRHPLTIFFGYFTVFLIGMTMSPFLRDKKKHWGGPVAVLIHFGLLVLFGLTLGWVTALMLVVLPLFVALGLGSYLFYAQHNFPAMELRDRRTWDYTFAALRSSSMFDMNPVLHWFTGNIGYHHIHHLNHRIPFYRLPEAMAAIPELQHPGRTSWRLKEVAACLRLAVWDPKEGRMLTYRETAERLAKVDAAA